MRVAREKLRLNGFDMVATAPVGELERVLEGDALLVATGRTPTHSEALSLAAATSRSSAVKASITVAEETRTRHPS